MPKNTTWNGTYNEWGQRQSFLDALEHYLKSHTNDTDLQIVDALNGIQNSWWKGLSSANYFKPNAQPSVTPYPDVGEHQKLYQGYGLNKFTVEQARKNNFINIQGDSKDNPNGGYLDNYAGMQQYIRRIGAYVPTGSEPYDKEWNTTMLGVTDLLLKYNRGNISTYLQNMLLEGKDSGNMLQMFKLNTPDKFTPSNEPFWKTRAKINGNESKIDTTLPKWPWEQENEFSLPKNPSLWDMMIQKTTPQKEGEEKKSGTLLDKIFGKGSLDKVKALLSNKQLQTDLMGLGRVIVDNTLNTKYTNDYINSLRTPLANPYQLHRRVLGDYAGQRQQYDLAASLEHKANKAFSSDVNLTLASRLEAFDKANLYRLLGNVLDNKAVKETSEAAWTTMAKNAELANTVANKNAASMAEYSNLAAKLRYLAKAANMQNWDKWLSRREARIQQEADLNKARQEALDDLVMKNALPDKTAEMTALYTKYYNLNPNDADYETKKAELESSIEKLKNEITKTRIEFYKQRYGITPTVDFDSQWSWEDSYKKKRGGLIIKAADGAFIQWTPPEVSSQSSKASSQAALAAASSKSDKDDLTIKDIAKALLGVQGLVSDYDLVVSSIYTDLSVALAVSNSLGGEVNSLMLVLKYLSTLEKINRVKRGQKEYDNAYNQAKSQDALGEIAVTGDGYLYVVNVETRKYEKISPAEYLNNKDKYKTLTNSNLLYLRENDSSLAFNSEIANIVSLGTSMQKIALTLRTLVGNLGKDTILQDRYVKKGAELLTLLGQGVIEETELTVTQQKQITAAMNVIANMLPQNMKTLLIVKGGGPELANKLIYDFITKGTSETHKITFNKLLNSDGSTIGSQGSKTNSKSENGGGGDKTTTYYDMVTGRMGTKTNIVINPGSIGQMSVDGRTAVLYDLSNRIIPPTSLLNVLNAGIATITSDLGNITFGNIKVTPEMQKNIAIESSQGVTAILPKKSDGTVNLEISERWTELVLEAIRETGGTSTPEDHARFEQILAKKIQEDPELSHLVGPNGKVDYDRYFQKYLIINGYAVTGDDRFGDEANEKFVTDVSSDNAKVSYVEGLLTTDPKHPVKIDIDSWTFPWRLIDTLNFVFEGSIYIPLTSNESDMRHGLKVESEASLLYAASEQERERLNEESPDELAEKIKNAKLGNSSMILN